MTRPESSFNAAAAGSLRTVRSAISKVNLAAGGHYLQSRAVTSSGNPSVRTWAETLTDTASSTPLSPLRDLP